MRRLALPVAGLCGFALAVVPALADDQSVTASGTSFSPNRVGVKPGEKVTVSKSGSGGFHDLHWVDTDENEEPLPTNSAWSHERTFTADGEYVFFCSYHGAPNSGMRGTVYVNATGTVPGSGGGTTTTGTTTTTTGGGGGGGPTQTQPPPGGTNTTPSPGGTQTTPAPGDDTTAPRMESARVSASRRGVRVTVTLSEPATVVARLLRGRRTVARRTVQVTDELTFRIRRSLRKGRYRIRLVVSDDAGNVARRLLRTRVR
jgi:plastocyanin